jgi:hypothetical protein
MERTVLLLHPFHQRTFLKSSPKDIEKSSPISDTLHSLIYKIMTDLNGVIPVESRYNSD